MNPETRAIDSAKVRAPYLRRTYGITVEQYDAMHEAQRGLCAICGRPERSLGGVKGKTPSPLAIDHDHCTGKIRGLLCSFCNRALGCFGDDPALVRAAADYLDHHARST
jgi:hypothetical protein